MWTTRPYDPTTHALAGVAADVDDADEALASLVTDELLARVAADVPDEWLAGEPGFDGPEAVRAAYVALLAARLAARRQWLPGLRACSSCRFGPTRPTDLRTGS